MTLRELIAHLPDEATVPVGWLRAQLGAENGADASTPAMSVLTVGQVAGQFHRSPSTIRAWAAAGRFADAFKLDGQDWRIPTAAVERFISEQSRPKQSRDVSAGATNATPPISQHHPRRARKADAADLGAWRRERPEGDAE